MSEQPDNQLTGGQPTRTGGMSQFPDSLAGLPGLWLKGDHSARAFIAHQGAQVLSWQDDSGRERLYLSAQTGGYRREDPDNTLAQPIRGGIPVSFPQFSGRGPLLKHGFARNLLWHLASATSPRENATTNRATLALHEDAQTLAIWPQPFLAEISMTLDANRLTVALTVQNTGNSAWDFTVALHTYFRVADIMETRLLGLQGVRYQDATANNVERIQQEAELRITGEVDRVYLAPPASLVLVENSVPSLRIEQQGFPDTVVWNPGPDKARELKDFPDDDWRHMVCVEAACAAHPITLQPGETWQGKQILSAVSAVP